MQNSDVCENLKHFESFWYAALVQAKCENIVAKQISGLLQNLEVWVASRTELRKSAKANAPARQVEVVLLPSYVFFRFPQGTQRSEKYAPLLEIKKLSKVYRLVMSPDHAYGEWEGAHIPDLQMERLKFVLEMSDKPVCVDTKRQYVKGDRVRVIRGGLMGLEGTIAHDDNGKDRIYVAIDRIGYASTEISRLDVEYIHRGPGRPRKQDAKASIKPSIK